MNNARRSLVCGHTRDDSRGHGETEIECIDRKSRFHTFERHPLVRIPCTSLLDALLAPRLWKQMRELVNFPLRVRRFTGGPISGLQLLDDVSLVQLHVLRQSPPAIFVLVSARSLASPDVSTCPTSCRAWVKPTHPNGDPAMSKVVGKTVAMACRLAAQDSHDGQLGSHEFSSCFCAQNNRTVVVGSLW